MRKYAIILLVLMFSCESKINYKKPEDLIPKKEMINLLVDMHLANGANGVVNNIQKENKNFMSVVYEKFQIDSTRYAISNRYYISNINEYEKILKKVEQRLKEIQELYTNKKDSIIKLRNKRRMTREDVKADTLLN